MQDLKNKAVRLFESGIVTRLVGWKTGEFSYDMTPAVFSSVDDINSGFVYNEFCGANLSKYLIKESSKEGKVLVFLKPCDTFSFNQLTAEHKINRDNVYVVGIPCRGKADINKIKASGIDGITGIVSQDDSFCVNTIYGDSTVKKSDVYADRCLTCKSKRHTVYDELIGEDGEDVADCKRFDMVVELETMSADERYEFWRNELSKCIRCNACRNVCPACTCEQCVFDNPDSGVSQKAAVDSFEENMFHIIRAFHVAGRCTDCGECSRVCPQQIPLHLLNRKIIKDINELYGEYQAGDDTDSKNPLTSFNYDDAEPSVVHKRGNE